MYIQYIYIWALTFTNKYTKEYKIPLSHMHLYSSVNLFLK